MTSADEQPVRWSRARTVVAVAALCAVVGLALGIVWWALAPRVPLVVVGQVAVPDEYQPGGFIAVDGVFALVAMVAGAVAVSLLLWRDDRVLLVLGAGVVGGVLGSLTMWWAGTRLGRVDVSAVAAASPDGTVFDAPLQLRLPGVLLLWPIVVAGVVTATAMVDWWLERRARRATEPAVSG